MIDYDETFPQSPLTEAVFELRFPIQFNISQKIGDFQNSLLDEFGTASELRQQGVTMSSDSLPTFDTEISWAFAHNDGDPIIKLFRNKILLLSTAYKSYNTSGEKSFRPHIEYTVGKLLAMFNIPKIKRIGMRFINKCEIDQLNNESFSNYYNSIINIKQYPMENILEANNIIRIKREKAELTVRTGVIREDEKYIYMLDFDAYNLECKIPEYMQMADNLHEVILTEFHSLITEEYRNKLRGV